MRTSKVQWLGLPVLLVLSSCSERTKIDEPRLGALDLALSVAGLEVSSVRLEVSGETNDVRRVRNIDVTDPNATISAKESGLLAGSYSIALSAHPAVDLPETAADERDVECEGSVGGVQVEAGKTTDVDDLVLLCTVDGGKVQLAGSIKVQATAVLDAGSQCTSALIEDAFIGALSASVGSAVDLTAKVATGSSLSWSASAGLIADADSAETTFTCSAQPGNASVKLTVTNGDCSESATVIVECVGASAPLCGNGVIEAGEGCDDGNTTTEPCAYGTPSCEVCGTGCQQVNSAGAYCGDGVVNGAEQCDGSAGCTASCTVSAPNPVCGNNVVEAGEGCDDGNTVAESCSYGTPSCQVCGASCQLISAAGAYCGDGVVNGGEQCDGSVGCTASCTTSTPTAVCGNNVVEAGEGCDDGNTTTESCAYGIPECAVCGASCQWTEATGAYCGDGVVNGSEQCDGSNGCSGECVALSRADSCEACIQNAEDADFRAFNETQCNNDPLCVNLKRCLINDTSDPVTTGRSCFNYIPATCYCGITTDFTPCEVNPSFVATGPCAAETIAAVGNAATPQDVFQRVTDTDYASGRAYQIVDFARQVCTQECGFTRGN